jgi:hypothetical protein
MLLLHALNRSRYSPNSSDTYHSFARGTPLRFRLKELLMAVRKGNPDLTPEFTVLSTGAISARARPAMHHSGDRGSNEHGERL